jgi:hypothetical protein
VAKQSSFVSGELEDCQWRLVGFIAFWRLDDDAKRSIMLNSPCPCRLIKLTFCGNVRHRRNVKKQVGLMSVSAHTNVFRGSALQKCKTSEISPPQHVLSSSLDVPPQHEVNIDVCISAAQEFDPPPSSPPLPPPLPRFHHCPNQAFLVLAR